MGLTEKHRMFKNVICGESGVFNSPKTPPPIRSDDGNNFLFYKIMSMATGATMNGKLHNV
jgi:hypothetical protein